MRGRYSTRPGGEREWLVRVCVAKSETVPTWNAVLARVRAVWETTMIYILAVFLPPLALLLNGQIFSAILNVVLIALCLFFGVLFLVGFFVPAIFLIPSAHAVIAIYMRRKDRQHEEIVEAIRQHGPPPGWRR